MNTATAISPSELQRLMGACPPPQLLDVRRGPAFERDPVVLPGAVRRDHEAPAAWSGTLEPWRTVVVYCVHGDEVSRDTASALRAMGFASQSLAGGLEAWRDGGGTTVAYAPPTRWVTRERPKIDRIACPWLIRRFIDASAEFFYVPASEVHAFAEANGATPYDVPDVTYSHAGAQCSFDAFIRIHDLADAALHRLAAIVRAADTDTLALAPEAPGLLATSLGLSRMFADDHAMLRWGMLVYDALHARCRDAVGAAAVVRAGTPAAADRP